MTSKSFGLIAAALIIAAGAQSGCSAAASSETPGDGVSQSDNAEKKPVETMAVNPEIEKLDTALAMYDSELYSTARDMFREMQREFPSSYYAPLFELKIADCAYALGEFKEAIESYEEFARLRPSHEAIPYVRLQIANSHLAQDRGVMHDQSPLQEALKHYEKVAEEFPGSAYAGTAKRLIRKCRERVAAHEAYVARFYHKTGLESAGTRRIADMVEKYGSQKAARLVGPELVQVALKETRSDAAPILAAAGNRRQTASRGGSDRFAARARLGSPARRISRSDKSSEPEPADHPQQSAAAKLLAVHCSRKEGKRRFLLEFSKAPEVEVLSRGGTTRLQLTFAEEGILPPQARLLNKLDRCAPRGSIVRLRHRETRPGTGQASSLLLSVQHADEAARFDHLVLDQPHRLAGIFSSRS